MVWEDEEEGEERGASLLNTFMKEEGERKKRAKKEVREKRERERQTERERERRK